MPPTRGNGTARTHFTARTVPLLSVLISVDCPPLASASYGRFGAALDTLARALLTTVALRVRPRYLRHSGGCGRS